jgi:hypothetical protein
MRIKLELMELEDRTVPTRLFEAGASVLSVTGNSNGTGARYAFTNSLAFIRGQATPFIGYNGPVQSATGDVNGDGFADIVYGVGPGGGSFLQIIDGRTGTTVFPRAIPVYEPSFTGGINIAVTRLNLQGTDVIVVAPDQGGSARVQIFQLVGGQLQLLQNFFAIDDPAFRGGARVALGDINGDGSEDLVVGAGFGGGPRVAIYNGATLLIPNVQPAKLIPDFFAFEPGLRDGVFVAVGDLNGDGFQDPIFGGGPGGGPRVTAYNGLAIAQGFVPNFGGPYLINFFAFDPSQRGGVRVTVKNIDGDTFGDLVVGSGDNIVPQTVITYLGRTMIFGTNIPPAPRQAFNPFSDPRPFAGVFVG